MKKLIIASITAVVVVVVMAGVLMPILDDATSNTDTVANDGLYEMSEILPTGSLTAQWKSSAPFVLTVNDETVALPSTAGTFPYTILGGDDFMARLLIEGNAKYFQVFYGSETTQIYEAKTANGTNMNMTLAGGVLTFDNGSGTTVPITLTDSFYCVSNDGDFVMKAYNDTGYVLEDSPVLALGLSSVNGQGSTKIAERVVIEGTIEDGFTATYLPYEVAIGDITATYADSVNTNFLDLYDFEKLAFTATYDSTDTDLTYSQILVPAEVTAEKAVHFTDGENAIFGAIPVMVIVALLLAIVAMVLRSRMD